MVKYNKMIINNKKKFYLLYTLAFALLMGMVVFFYYSSGNSLINYGGDGFRQYFRALVYYSNYLRTIAGNLINNHRFIIPQWDFSIGEGSDVLITFHYYGMGDIINLLSVFVPEKQIYLFYDASIVLRMYLSGLFFSLLCTYSGKKNYDGVFIGSVLYAFSGFSLVSLSGHIAFLNAPMYLPLVILGVEKIIKENTVSFLMLSVGLCSFASFYFFYMIAVMTVIYVGVRLICLEKSWKDRGLILLKIASGSITGVLISAAVFVPYVAAALGSDRVTSSIKTFALYPASHYFELLHSLVFSYENLFGNYSVLFIPAVVLLFVKEKRKELKILLLCGLIFLCSPLFGLVFNGFVYSTDRWLFGLSLVVNFVIVDTYDYLLSEKKTSWIAFGLLVAYMLFCTYADSEYWQIYALFCIASITLFVFVRFSTRRWLTSLACIGVALFSVFFSVFYRYSPFYWSYAGFGTPISAANSVEYEQSSTVSNLEESFYRYTADPFVTNSSIHTGQSTTQYYWSLANDDVIEFRNDLGLSDHNNHHYDNYDGRLSLNSLACVKYLVSSKESQQLGYQYAFSDNGYNVYQSEYSLPMMYLYENYVDKEFWMSTDIPSRQQILLDAAVVEGELPLINRMEIKKDSESVQYVGVYGDGVLPENDSLTITSVGSSVDYTFECEEGYEYYLVIEGLDSDTSVNIGVSDLSGNVKTLFFKCNTHNAYPNRHNFAMCLGTSDKGEKTTNVAFYSCGKFNYSSISIQRLSVDKQIASINKLKSTKLSDLSIETNEISANINSDKDSILCIAVPYSKGWKAYVDGKEVEIIKTNVMNMGVLINEGEHTVDLKYSTPFLKIGTAISIFGIAVWMATKKKERKRPAGE